MSSERKEPGGQVELQFDDPATETCPCPHCLQSVCEMLPMLEFAVPAGQTVQYIDAPLDQEPG